ncbi:PAS domain-containing protein [Streptomyces sp. NPDC000594]|uniref:helix-turn-helix transcriptional regulator n=1 Tax=Streptomyces sp. NPDC000594 TaxID=3154261 RepID=UPI003318711B
MTREPEPPADPTTDPAADPPADPRLRQWEPVARAIALLLGPYAEVVLHDPETDRVLGIWNPTGSRRAGDPSYLGELAALDPAGRDVHGPYEKVLADGRRLSSVSAVLRAPDGHPSAVLCVNLDRTPLERAAALLSSFGAPTEHRPEPLFEQDWTERIQHVVGGWVRDHGRPVERFGRADRLAVVRLLDEAGVFAVRRAVPVVAGALGSSRSTVYALLAECRAERTPA